MSDRDVERLLRLVVIARRALLTLVVLLVILYAGDWLQAWSRRSGSGLGSVTFYVAVTLKNGRTEIYYDQPQTEICVRALFPHLGHRPCWYAARQPVHAE